MKEHTNAIRKAKYSIKDSAKVESSVPDSKAVGVPTIFKRSKFDIPPPKFSGKATDWNGFHDLFTAALKSQGDLCDAERMCLLLDSMQTPAAREIVESYRSQGEGSFHAAMEHLKRTYGAPSVLYPYHVREVVKKDSYDYDGSVVPKIRKRVLIQQEAMERLGGGTLPHFLVALVAEDFSPKLLDEWSKYTSHLKRLPITEDLLEFLKPLESRYRMKKSRIARSNCRIQGDNTRLQRNHPSVLHGSANFAILLIHSLSVQSS